MMMVVHRPISSILRVGSNNRQAVALLGRLLLIRCTTFLPRREGRGRCESIISSSTTTTRRYLSSSNNYHDHIPDDPSYVDIYTNSSPTTKKDFLNVGVNSSKEKCAAVVYPNFISPEEGELLSTNILSKLKRRRYEKGHWDSVITNYKEIELSDDIFLFDNNNNNNSEGKKILEIFDRIRNHLQENHLNDTGQKEEIVNINWLPCHAIDLKKDGELNAHVDSIKFSGHLVSGLSLLSPSIMRLIPSDDDDDNNNDEDHGENEDDGNIYKEEETSAAERGWVDLYLPPLSLYVLTGIARYKYSHQLLPTNSTFRFYDYGNGNNENEKESATTVIVERDHRLSIIFRDAKQN